MNQPMYSDTSITMIMTVTMILVENIYVIRLSTLVGRKKLFVDDIFYEFSAASFGCLNMLPKRVIWDELRVERLNPEAREADH